MNKVLYFVLGAIAGVAFCLTLASNLPDDDDYSDGYPKDS